jgi:nicotinamide-nucleotide amidase
MVEPVKNELYKRLSKYIYGEDNDTLESVVVDLLRKKGLAAAFAESCTGGLLSARLTNVPGVSDVFNESAVTYSNAAKTSRLGVSPDTIAEHGAVSFETAKSMAEGIAKTSNADIGVAVTGIAGPGGGSEEKPVGLVYVAVFSGGKHEVSEMKWSGSRERIRSRAVAKALEMIWRYLIST